MNGGMVGGAQEANLDLGGKTYIENCAFNGTINGGMLTGGIVGATGQRIINCTNNGNVSANIYAGGIVGYYQEQGGIAPFEILNCVNTGNVSTTNGWAGGIVGEMYVSSVSSLVANCYNVGAISGGSQVGGIAGSVYNGKIYNCYNIGSIAGNVANTDDLGGVVGYLTSGCISNCYSSGESTNGAEDSTAGIAGENYGVVQYSYSTVTPLVGSASTGTSENNAQIANGAVDGTALHLKLNNNILSYFVSSGENEEQTWWQSEANCWQVGENNEYAKFAEDALIAWGYDGVIYDNAGSFADLRTAIGNLEIDGTIYARMTADMQLDSSIVAPSNKTVVLDLAGHILTAPVDGGQFLVSSANGELILNDSSEDKSGVVTGSVDYSAVEVQQGGAFIMNGGTITSNHGGNRAGGVYALRNSEFTMNGGTITANTSDNVQAGVYAASGSAVEISGNAVITGNTGLDGDCDLWLDTLNGNALTIGDNGLDESARIGVYINSRNFEFAMPFTYSYEGGKATESNFINNSGNFEVKEIETEDGQKQMTLSRIQTLTLSASPSISVSYGKEMTLTATLVGANSDSGKIINFYNDATTEPTLLGTATTSGGAATLALSDLEPGIYRFRAAFEGTESYEYVGSDEIAYAVTKAVPSLSFNIGDPTGDGGERSAIIRATVEGVSDTDIPTGSVEIVINGEVAGTVDLTDGAAEYTWNNIPVGDNSVSIVYSGDSNYSGIRYKYKHDV